MISRILEQTISKRLFQGKAITVTGPRQTGKTTLVRQIVENANASYTFLNADEPDVARQLEGATSTALRRIIANRKIVVIDEAQRINNIGPTLKLITDEIPDVQLIVTGSSSLDIANTINEPLTGRKFEFRLYPMSFQELEKHNGFLEENRLLESRLIYGSYPDIVNHPGDETIFLSNLADAYLYKDLLSMEQVRRPELLHDILEALALQLGNEVRYTELGQTVGADQATVKKYVELLEKSFVIFRLRAFSRNVRNEIKKSRKIYFLDNGIRNAIIRNFSPASLRSDIGALWENYLISERVKFNSYNHRLATMHFWRTTQNQEIDLVEEKDGQLSAFEFKWSPAKNAKWSKTFINNYDVTHLEKVDRENYFEFVG